MKPLPLFLALLIGTVAGSSLTFLITRRVEKQKVSAAMASGGNVAIAWTSVNDLTYARFLLGMMNEGKTDATVTMIEKFIADKTKLRDAAARGQAFQLNVQPHQYSPTEPAK